jgi:hypothetical protein
MQNFNEQQLNLIKNSSIVFATWEIYKELFKWINYLDANDGRSFQSEFFNKLPHPCNDAFPFQEGLFVYLASYEARICEQQAIKKEYTNDKTLLEYYNMDKPNFLYVFNRKTFEEFLAIKNDLIQKEEQKTNII